jgi:NADH dehydrogenase
MCKGCANIFVDFCYNSPVMILITGGTGFVGNALIKHLVNLDYSVKLLIQPSKNTPNLPKGLPLEVAVTSLKDEKGLRAAMKGVDYIYHLASGESLGRKAELAEVDIRGTESLIQAATTANIKRIFYLSHIGADRASAFPLLKAKGIAEQVIKGSKIPFTIFRSAILYGERDHFTNGLAFLLKVSPLFVMLPNEGKTLFQPLWIEDLARALTWSIDMPDTINKTIKLGGPEYLSFREICEIIIGVLGIKRNFVNVSPVFLNVITELLEIIVPNFPTSVFWSDFLAVDRTTDLDVLPQQFNLIPARMNQHLAYLKNTNFRINIWRMIIKRKRTIQRWD